MSSLTNLSVLASILWTASPGAVSPPAFPHVQVCDIFHFDHSLLAAGEPAMSWEVGVKEFSLQGYNPASWCLLWMLLIWAHVLPFLLGSVSRTF